MSGRYAMGYQDEVRREFLRDEPRGGFVTEVVCPHCSREVPANIPSTPGTKHMSKYWNGSDWEHYESGVSSITKCQRCSIRFAVYRYMDGSWVVKKS